jgi:hypothetical protein
VLLAVPSVVIGIFGYRWIHRVMQATAVVVGVSLVIMFIQGLRHGALPAHETGLAAPALGPVAAIGAVSGERDTLRECRRAGRRGCRRVRPGTLFVPLRALQAT